MDWRIPADMKTPVRAFHGDADPTVPVEYSKFLCKAVNERGGKAELTVYPAAVMTHGPRHMRERSLLNGFLIQREAA